MQSNQQSTSKEDNWQKRGINLELFYYEQVGSRYYLRFTRLALVIILGLTIISLVMILAVFLLSDHLSDSKEVNVNITVPKSSSPPTQIIIPPTPTQPAPKTNKQSRVIVPAPSPLPLPKVEELPSTPIANKSAETKSNRNSNER
jgi:type IV secretory pathway VirB10-like protein